MGQVPEREWEQAQTQAQAQTQTPPHADHADEGKAARQHTTAHTTAHTPTNNTRKHTDTQEEVCMSTTTKHSHHNKLTRQS